MICNHQCSGNCRREGCNCACGEFHEGEKGHQHDFSQLYPSGKMMCASCGEEPEFPVMIASGITLENWETMLDKRFKYVYHPNIKAENIIQDTTEIKTFINELLVVFERHIRNKISNENLGQNKI